MTDLTGAKLTEPNKFWSNTIKFQFKRYLAGPVIKQIDYRNTENIDLYNFSLTQLNWIGLNTQTEAIDKLLSLMVIFVLSLKIIYFLVNETY